MFETNSRAPFEILARLGRALASPQRLRLLHLLAQCERSVEELAAAMSEPLGVTSHHLQQLAAVHLVAARRQGRRVIYALAGEPVLRFWLLFRSFAETRLGELQLLRQMLAAERAASGTIDRQTLQRECRQGRVVLVDVRPRAEYEAGHIPGAISVPLDLLPQQAQRIPKDKTIILYCRGPYCLLAFKAREQLAERGVRALCLADGPVEWAADNLPLERETPERPAKSGGKRKQSFSDKNKKQ